MKRALLIVGIVTAIAATPGTADASRWQQCGNNKAYYLYSIQALNTKCQAARAVAHTWANRGFPARVGEWRCRKRSRRHGISLFICGRYAGRNREYAAWFTPLNP